MRLIASLTVLTLLALAAPAIAADKSPTPSAAAYASLEATDANACARACAADGLCMSWIFSDNYACELLAVVPLTDPVHGVAGVAVRAPPITRQQSYAQAPVPIEAAKPEPARAPEGRGDDLALLGGPEDAALRPRLTATP